VARMGGGARPNSLRNMVRLNLAAYLGKIPTDAKGWGRNSGAALPNCPAKYSPPTRGKPPASGGGGPKMRSFRAASLIDDAPSNL